MCVLRHSFFPMDVRVRREVNALTSSGVDVDVICLRLPGQPWTERVNGVNVYRVPVAHRRSDNPLRYVYQYVASLLCIATMVSALHARRRYDAVQVNTMPDFLALAALLPKVAGARLVLDIQDLMPEIASAKFGWSAAHPLVRLLSAQEGLSMRLADRVITVTDEFKERLVQRHRRYDPDVIMNCPDETIFPRVLPAEATRKRVEAADGRFVLMSHGVLLERLGYDTAIEAVAMLGDRIPGLELHIAGPGEYGTVLRGLVDRLGVSERVVFDGYVPLEDVPSLVAGADLGIVANKNDGCADLMLPTKLLEYVRMGKPVAVARTSTIAHYFDESMVGFFEPGDASQLAERIWELYRDPEARYNLAANASRFFDEHSWAVEAVRYRRLIDSVAAAPSRSGRVRSAIVSSIRARLGRAPSRNDAG